MMASMEKKNNAVIPFEEMKGNRRSNFIFNRMVFVLAAEILFIILVAAGGRFLGAVNFTRKVLTPVFVGAAVAAAVLTAANTFPRNIRFASLSPRFVTTVLAAYVLLFRLTFTFTDVSYGIIASFILFGIVLIRHLTSADFFYLSLVCFLDLLLAYYPRISNFGGLPKDTMSYAAAGAALFITVLFFVFALVFLKARDLKLSKRFFDRGVNRVYPLFVLPACFLALSAVRMFIPAAFPVAAIVFFIFYLLVMVAYAFDRG